MRKAGYGDGFELVVDLPAHHLKRGHRFYWNRVEQSYTAEGIPWMITPMVEWWQIKDTKLFRKIRPKTIKGTIGD